MINAVNTQPTIKSSIFYINDLHGQIPKMEQIASASIQFDEFVKQEKTDGLKLSSGDIFIGKDEKRNQTAAAFLSTMGIQASALGNHEFDMGVSAFAKIASSLQTVFLGMNLNHPENGPLKSRVIRSSILEENGNQYGLIGIQPVDLNLRITNKDILEGITIDDEVQTLKELQEEVNILRNQGINKIILLSHVGNKIEQKIAQSISGIDVILGGHSHELIEDIQEGKNLFYSPEGEPVIITQAGRDGNNFGILNLEYNNQGVIVAAQNNVLPARDYSKSLLISTLADKILGVSPKIGTLAKSDPDPKQPLIEENAYADFVSDAIRSEMGVDIVLINSGNFRGDLKPGTITERDISGIFPFKNRLCKVELNEKELVEALKFGATSLNSPDNKPNILQVSGLTYTIDSRGSLIEVQFIDKQGKRCPIDINNPNPNKKYITIYDDFLCNGGDNFSMLKKMDSIIEYYPFDKDKVTVDYIKKLEDKPFNIEKDNRIKFI